MIPLRRSITKEMHGAAVIPKPHAECPAGTYLTAENEVAQTYITAAEIWDELSSGRMAEETETSKSHLVIRSILQQHVNLLRTLSGLADLLPHPLERKAMSKRRWERLLYRARTILDLLEQGKHKLLFRYIHAEAAKLPEAQRSFLAKLVDPDDVPSAQHKWRNSACATAVRLQFHLDLQERGRAEGQDVLGGSDITQFCATWARPLPSIVGEVLGITSASPPAFYMAADPENEDTTELPTCTVLKQKHGHARDGHLTFEAAQHRYFLDGRPVDTSVSGTNAAL